MEDDAPALGVGFAIDAGNSFSTLGQLQAAIGTTEAKVARDAAKIEQATAGMVKLGGATAQVLAFGNAHTQAEREIRLARNAAEKSGEGMVRQLERQISTYGKTTTEIRSMRAELRAVAAEEAGLTELAGRIRTLNAQMNDLENGTGKVTKGAVANRMAMQGASYQVQDFITQVSMGANPVNAFAVQSAQLAGQFSSVEGKAGNVARFFMGPWGLAITAGLMVLGPFLDKLLSTNSALDDAVDKLRKDAEQTEINRRAKELFIKTHEGVRKALLDATDANEKWIASQRTAVEQAAILARSQELAAQRALAETERKLAGARERLKGFTGPAGSDPRLAPARQSIEAEIAALQGLATSQRQLLEQLGMQTRSTFVELADDIARKVRDPIERIKLAYEGSNGIIAQAKRRLVAEGATTEEAARQLSILRQKQNVEIAEEQRRQASARSAANENRQIGRSVSLSEAEGIVRSIGGVITSTTRSFEEQRVLYERYLAGKGPLAAKPGTSDHEVGNALDIRKTPGMSLAKIREAFRAQGVAIKQLLDEGTHFHVSWKRGSDEAAAAAKRLADEQAALVKKFDPAQAALDDYRKALAAIAAAKLNPEDATRYADAAREAFIKARAAAFELPSMPSIQAEADAQAAAEKSAAEFKANVLKPLQDEVALRGLVGTARATAALELEREAFIARYELTDGLAVAIERWEQYRRIKMQAIGRDAQDESARRLAEEADLITRSMREAGDAMARAFGDAGGAIADAVEILATYGDRQKAIAEQAKKFGWDEVRMRRESGRVQIGMYGDLTEAALGFFERGSKGYADMTKAVQVFRAIEFALSVRAMAQDIKETAVAIVNSAKRVAKFVVEGIAAQAKLPFPLNIAAMAATGAALAAIGAGVAGAISGGGGNSLEPSNTGTGTVFGDSKAQSESIKRTLDQLREIDTTMLTFSREMAASLRSIDNQIGGFTNVILRSGDVNASSGVAEGFKPNAIGSVLGAIPLIGGFLKSLFGSTTTVIGSGLYGGPQSLGSILSGGFAGQTYSDIEKKSKFLGITTGKKYSTQYGNLDQGLEDQFTLILRSFNNAILAAAGPLGASTSEIAQRLNSFVFSIGKIDLKGLTGEQIQEKLSAVFGAAADQMAMAAFPGYERFQRAGEGMFETLIRVASTVEVVSANLDMLGGSARALGIDAQLALADQFESLSAMSSAIDSYFGAYYSKEEQAAAQLVQFERVFAGLGITMPGTLASFRALVEAQDLNTDAGRATYATLIQLAPAFAELQNALSGAKSAADIAAERADLERKLLELQGNTAELRVRELAKLDASNRDLQRQIWAAEEAQEAARAADELRKAWQGVGTSIRDEINRIRGITGGGEGNFASIMGQFNAALAATRAGDIEAAKTLPGLSQSLLRAAELQATSRQELDRIRAQTAASLESVLAKANGGSGGSLTASGAMPAAALLENMAAIVSIAQDRPAANDDLAAEVRSLKAELAAMRSESTAGLAAVAGHTSRIAKKMDDVTAQSGGDAVSTVAAA